MSYESKAITVAIKATSRVSVKIRDNFYTLEYTEERQIPDVPDVNIEEERAILWDIVNAEVDRQVEDVAQAVKSTPTPQKSSYGWQKK